MAVVDHIYACNNVCMFDHIDGFMVELSMLPGV